MAAFQFYFKTQAIYFKGRTRRRFSGVNELCFIMTGKPEAKPREAERGASIRFFFKAPDMLLLLISGSLFKKSPSKAVEKGLQPLG